MQRTSRHRPRDAPPGPPKPRGGRPPSREDRRRLRRLFAFVGPYRGRLVAGLLTLAAGSALTLAGPVILRFLVDAIVPGGDPRRLGRLTLLLVAVFAAQSGVRTVSTYLLAYVGERLVLELRLALYRHLQSLSLSFFNRRRTGELVSRLTNDVTTVRSLVAEDTASALSQLLVFTGALGLLLATDWRLTLLMLAVVPGVVLLGLVFGRRLRALSTRVQDELATATTVLEESIGGVRVVQSFVREEHELDRFGGSVRQAFSVAMDRTRLGAAFGPLVSFLFLAAVVALVWYGGRQVLAGGLTAGQLVTFLVLTMFLTGSVGTFTGLWTRLQQALGASERLFDLLDTRPEVAERPDARPLPPARGRITFEGVWFTYPGEEEGRFALAGIDLEVEPGEVLALVGPSGAGKSTSIHLIPRFYDPTLGRILVDGVDLREVTLASLRRQVGVVPQETYLFGGTVRENLLYGRLDAGEEELVAAARAANAHDFIAALPQGYDTVVGERGVRLSGGQRQRLSIARALLKDPRILLLDEATSSLDSASERLVEEALERLMQGRTSVVIAHRLSTVRRADRIAVLDAGRLVELGSHEALRDAGGLYARLDRLQLRGGAAGARRQTPGTAEAPST